MLWHAIAPSRRYTKASHDVVRHPRLNSDAKILLLYVQGLPEQEVEKALSDHAKSLGISGRAYQRAKKQLLASGFVHEWKRQGRRGYWVTDQLFANISLTDEQAKAVRNDRVGDVVRSAVDPGAQKPTVGRPRGRETGGYEPVEEELGKNYSHPPSEVVEVTEVGEFAEVAELPEVAESERVLLSLRHAHPQLHLGVREARGLADAAAEWIRRGVSAADLRRALTSELPREGVRSAVGFLRHRLVQKLPAPPAAPAAAPVSPPPARELIACEAEGAVEEHVFRPIGDETVCGPCYREERAAALARWREEERNKPPEPTWRERVAALGGATA
ncbi:hypothetical protein AB0467_01780 [Streptomyces sp. NPDC052095]|uniref:hypothetical protein n=1 Tax=unclassified Streptomyces TaxID=2593676 RepID=UPI00344DD7D4